MPAHQYYPQLTYGSVCSGIEAATVAWHPLGLRAAWFAEIEPFPSAVLAHRYPNTPNLGDMTRLAAMVLTGKIPAPDLLVGGTPCQAFSVAGMRAGLDDPRGALTIKYVELADAVDHVRTSRGEDECVIVWENVPGVLSDKGNAFGCFLGALVGESEELRPPGGRWRDAGCMYGPKRTVAWRVLDAQYFGLAQRRRRVFVVASARRGFDPCEVLFEREGLRRDTAPRRGEGENLTGRAPFGPALQCGCGYIHDIELGEYGCPNCEGEQGPSVEVTAGVPAYGGHSLAGHGEIDQSATLTAKDTRMDMESETFFLDPAMAPLRGQPNASFRDDSDTYVIAGTLQANGKAAGSATTQDAESGLLVVHGTQDPDVLTGLAHPLGRNSGQENAVCVTGDVTHTLKADGFDGSEDGTGRGQPIVTHALQAGALRTNPSSGPDGIGVQADHAYTLEARAEVQAVQAGSAVRRLTPVECERLQGFPDNYTQIPYRNKPADLCPDGPRYKAIGNSKAVPVVRWIGRRIQQQLESSFNPYGAHQA